MDHNRCLACSLLPTPASCLPGLTHHNHSATLRRPVAELVLKHRLPQMFNTKEHAEEGGLMSYGTDMNDMFRRAATYIDKILKGAKPADLPVEQASRYQLVINLKTAKALGLEVPPTLLGRADEVIE